MNLNLLYAMSVATLVIIRESDVPIESNLYY